MSSLSILPMPAPLHVSAVRVRSILAVGLLMAGCHADPTDRPTPAPAPSWVRAVPSASVASMLTTCESDRACGEGQKCIRVDGPAPGRRCAIADPSRLVDAIGIPKWGADFPNIREDFVARLVMLRGVSLDVAPACQLKLCPRRAGKPADCCNTCRDMVVLRGSFASESSRHPVAIPVVDVQGLPLTCGTRMDCEKPSCPVDLGLGREREVVGTFERWGASLRFRLARAIGPASPSPSASRGAQ